MKDLDYQIWKAYHIADNNPNAYVGVFCNWQEAKVIIENAHFYGNMEWQSRKFTTKNGSRVSFFDKSILNGDDIYRLAGSEFTHVFTRDVWDHNHVAFLKYRIRSTHSFYEPMGLYDELGVMVREDY